MLRAGKSSVKVVAHEREAPGATPEEPVRCAFRDLQKCCLVEKGVKTLADKFPL